MAKKPKIEKENSPIDEAFEDAFKELDKMNPEAKFLNQNALSNVKEWIDTGNYALNGVISGSLFGGIPMGRLTGLIGPESCGKTLMAMKIIANAQKKGMRVVYLDSEGALDEDTAIRLSCDPSKIKHVPVEITEQCRNQIVKFLSTIVEKGLQGKVLIVIDSVGNLITMQEKKKIDEGNDAPDMGNRAKACLCPETLIHTADGFKKLKDVEKNDMVLTHLGRYRKIIDKWTVEHSEYIKIKTKTSDIILSKNHRLLVKRGSKLSYIEAQYIKSTDKLLKISEQNV